MMEFRIIKIVHPKKLVEERKAVLKMELDYLLISLHDAMKVNDEKEKESIKEQLRDIVAELDVLQA